MNKPLEGLFVVELTTYWAAPSAGEFLRCLGARVVKIETGKAGDSVRYWGRTCGMPIEANENPSFDLFNGGKEFMHMDLNDPEHERVLHNMLAKADVFLTSMRLGGLKKHNLDYDTLKERDRSHHTGVFRHREQPEPDRGVLQQRRYPVARYARKHQPCDFLRF